MFAPTRYHGSMNGRRCPPGQVRAPAGRCTPGSPTASVFALFPQKNVGVPGGGLYPFSNSAPAPAAPPATPAAGQVPFSFSYSGTIDSSTFEAVPLSLPFGIISRPLTIEVSYTFNPLDYRTNDGGFGGFGFYMHVPSKNFGFEFQGSNPSNFFVTVYSNYRPDPMNPGNLLADRVDYQIAVWPPGTPVVRITLDANNVPRLYFDGVESVITPPVPPQDQPLSPGDVSAVYGYNGAPGRTVTITSLKLVSGLIPPPAPL